jgi:hypothetical protein
MDKEEIAAATAAKSRLRRLKTGTFIPSTMTPETPVFKRSQQQGRGEGSRKTSGGRGGGGHLQGRHPQYPNPNFILQDQY